MPEETKGPEPVSPSPESAAPAASTPVPAKPEAPPVKPESAAAAPVAPAQPAAPAAAAKPVDAKPAAPAAAKPAAPAAAKPAAPAKPAGPQPEPWNSDLVAKFKKQYGSGILETSTYVGQKYLVVDGGIVFEILSRMIEDEQYDYCVDITAVHYPKREQQFDIVYILYSFQHNERVRVKAQIGEGQRLQSAVNDLAYRRIGWNGKCSTCLALCLRAIPDLKRILLPDEWKGHPLRKDYDILQQDKEWVQINLGIESGQ